MCPRSDPAAAARHLRRTPAGNRGTAGSCLPSEPSEPSDPAPSGGGRPGGVLDEALAEAGIDPATTYRTNVVKHFRWKGTRGEQRIHRSPTRAHVAACAPWLSAELALVHPTGVVLLGGTAGKAVHGTAFPVGEARGRVTEWPESFAVAVRPRWVLATTHPSAVLRADDRRSAYEDLVADLRVAAQRLG